MKPSAMLLLGVALAALFVALSVLVVLGITQSTDAEVAISINNHNLCGILTRLMVYASDYGRDYFWTALVGLMFLFGSRNTRMLAIELALLFAAAIVLGEAMKLLVVRERPFVALSPAIVLRVTPDYDSSYPSGHALIVSVGAFFSFMTFNRKAVAFFLTAEAAVVCYSRVYLGVHYPLDVLGGVVLGGAIVSLGLFAFNKYFSRPLRKVSEAFSAFFSKIGFPELF